MTAAGCPHAADNRHVYDPRNRCTLCGHDPLKAVRAAVSVHKRRQRARRVVRKAKDPPPGSTRLRGPQPRKEGEP